MENTAQLYLSDLGRLLREDWQEAEKRFMSSTGPERQFEDGRRRAYRQVLTLMLHQADVFCLAPSAVALHGIDVDKDLGY